MTNEGTAAVRTVTTSSAGSYVVPLLPPGTYAVSVTASGFATTRTAGVNVPAATTTTVNFSLELGANRQEVTVQSAAEILQTENSTNGGTVNQATVVGLPLTNRNYTQILGLSPGVASAIPNAAALGRNTVNVHVNGAVVSDNSFRMDGQDVSNMQSQSGGDSQAFAGISVPSPDSLEEFRVQTSLYDASYGRGSGGSVNVITKSGSNQFHGALFEFFRNNVLNANDYFVKRNNQARPLQRQNQFGGTLGGPILKDKLFFFGSYQGTRQIVGQGATALASPILPPISNDRSRATLGAQFCGQRGFNGGVAVACDGSNINPVALRFLNYKLSDGTYLIPTPQAIRNGQGSGVFSVPSRFSENQFMGNLDFQATPNHRISERFFYSRAPQAQSFTGGNVPGSGVEGLYVNSNFNVKDTWTISPTLINEFSIAHHRNWGELSSRYLVKSSEVGMPFVCDSAIGPVMTVTGSFVLGGGLNDGTWNNSKQYGLTDNLSWVHGSHNIRMGGNIESNDLPFAHPQLTRGTMTFSSFPDFLLGMSAAQNGSSFSNINATSTICGNTRHTFALKNYGLFLQDDFKVTPRLTLNLGTRWDIYGQTSDVDGMLVNIWPELAKNDFTNGQTFAGFVVPSNYKGAAPDGVYRNDNKTFAKNGVAWNNVEPRIGLSWQPGVSNRFVIRGGFGLYYAITSVNDARQVISNLPFVQRTGNTGVLNALSTFENPWNPPPRPLSDFPVWIPRTPTSNLNMSVMSPDFRSPRMVQWSFDTQFRLTTSTVLDVGYVGNHASRILAITNPNQSLLASPTNPVYGITINTLNNAPQRVPMLGFGPNGLSFRDQVAMSDYHALQMSLQKRMSHGLQGQISYTYSKVLTNFVGEGGYPSVGSIYNDQANPTATWGPADFNIPHRFIASFVWFAPDTRKRYGPLGHVLSDWGVSGVVTIQSGFPYNFTDQRSGTIYGRAGQLAHMCPGFTYADILRPGSVQDNLDGAFNTAAFCAPPAYVDPANATSIGYGYGNIGRGILAGPGQHNADLSVIREFKVPGPETARLQFRAEFFNALNTPQFAKAATGVGTASFGRITEVSVSPRLIQFGLKYLF